MNTACVLTPPHPLRTSCFALGTLRARSALGRYKPPPRNTKWIQAEKDAFYEIINGKQFQDSLTGKTFRNGTWKWVHEAMARNTGWTWARTLKSLMKFYEKL